MCKKIGLVKMQRLPKLCYQMFTVYIYWKQKLLYTLPYIFNKAIIYNAERCIFVAEKKSF